MMHFARATARGWDGSRMGHAAIAFLTMTALGALAMQSKEILAGRDPLSLDPSTGNGLRAWGKATLQGGGLGVFGDVLFVDQTKYGNTWAATVAGPVAGAVETVLGDFIIKNVQQAGKGEQTQFLGDALYAGGRTCRDRRCGLRGSRSSARRSISSRSWRIRARRSASPGSRRRRSRIGASAIGGARPREPRRAPDRVGDARCRAARAL
jgi:hypothetical protein